MGGDSVYTHRNDLATHTNRFMAGVCEEATICNKIVKNNTAIIFMISWYAGAFVQPLLTIIQVLTQIHPSHTQTHMQAYKYIIHTQTYMQAHVQAHTHTHTHTHSQARTHAYTRDFVEDLNVHYE